MYITKQVTLSFDEIIVLRSSIRARIRELDRLTEHYDDSSGLWANDKAMLKTMYEKLGKELDRI